MFSPFFFQKRGITHIIFFFKVNEKVDSNNQHIFTSYGIVISYNIFLGIV